MFGWLGDRMGRVRAMALSILCYSGFSGVGYWVATPEQLLLLRFLSGMGVGGMWPTGVSLASEAWPEVSRPMLAGLLGTSANVGLVLFNAIGYFHPVVPDSWRWTMLVCAAPLALGVLVWAVVPESQRWLATRHAQAAGQEGLSVGGVFRPPLLRLTLIGIALGTIPLLGGWGATQWLVFWADKVHGLADPRAKALTAIMRSVGRGGRQPHRRLAGQPARPANHLLPRQPGVAGRWASTSASCSRPRTTRSRPLCLPWALSRRSSSAGCRSICRSCFPTARPRDGIGRVVQLRPHPDRCSACSRPARSPPLLDEDYGRAGSITMLVYALGMVVILFAPDTTKSKLKD